MKSSPHETTGFPLKLSRLQCLIFHSTDNHRSTTCKDRRIKCLTLPPLQFWILGTSHALAPQQEQQPRQLVQKAWNAMFYKLKYEVITSGSLFMLWIGDWGRKQAHGFRMSELFKPAVQKCKGGMSGLWKKLNWTVFPCHQQQQCGCSECYQILGFNMKLCITRKKHLFTFSSPTLL